MSNSDIIEWGQEIEKYFTAYYHAYRCTKNFIKIGQAVSGESKYKNIVAQDLYILAIII